MERDVLNSALLFDTYGDLLTEKQRLCCDLRYNQDLSLGEIGELEGISRQAVRDNLVRAEAQMNEMEEKIGAVRRSLQSEAALEELRVAKAMALALGAPGEVSPLLLGDLHQPLADDGPGEGGAQQIVLVLGPHHHGCLLYTSRCV